MNACFPAFVLACALAANATAEHIVHGTIRDATTGEPLAAATVQIVGTYRATIANDEGQYALKVPALPATVRVVNIGYRSLELSVDSASSRLFAVSLAVGGRALPVATGVGFGSPSRIRRPHSSS